MTVNRPSSDEPDSRLRVSVNSRRNSPEAAVAYAYTGHMPTATLTYDLADPDDAGQHRLAISAIHLSAALHRIDEYCRSQIKYCEHDEKAVRVFEEIRQMMPNEMWEY